MLDRKTRRKIRNWVVGLAGARLLRLWTMTIRVRLSGLRRSSRGPLPGRNGIYVFWHHELFLPAGVCRDPGIRVLISRHSDGEMVARVVENLGMSTIRGSTARGGSEVVRQILKEQGRSEKLILVLTPDGPRGPRLHFQKGAIYLASRTGLPISFLGIATKRCWRLRSWDRFRVPKPFTRGLIRLSDPTPIPADLDRDGIEEHRRLVEERLIEFNEETEKNFDALWGAASRLEDLPPL